MALEMQNSNPTILNDADLPTRLDARTFRKPGAYGSGPIFTSAPADSNDFFSIGYYSDTEGENDLLEEPIDEQEIYGKERSLWYSVGAIFVDERPDVESANLV